MWPSLLAYYCSHGSHICLRRVWFGAQAVHVAHPITSSQLKKKEMKRDGIYMLLVVNTFAFISKSASKTKDSESSAFRHPSGSPSLPVPLSPPPLLPSRPAFLPLPPLPSPILLKKAPLTLCKLLVCSGAHH